MSGGFRLTKKNIFLLKTRFSSDPPCQHPNRNSTNLSCSVLLLHVHSPFTSGPRPHASCVSPYYAFPRAVSPPTGLKNTVYLLCRSSILYSHSEWHSRHFFSKLELPCKSHRDSHKAVSKERMNRN